MLIMKKNVKNVKYAFPAQHNDFFFGLKFWNKLIKWDRSKIIKQSAVAGNAYFFQQLVFALFFL